MCPVGYYKHVRGVNYLTFKQTHILAVVQGGGGRKNSYNYKDLQRLLRFTRKKTKICKLKRN